LAELVKRNPLFARGKPKLNKENFGRLPEAKSEGTATDAAGASFLSTISLDEQRNGQFLLGTSKEHVFQLSTLEKSVTHSTNLKVFRSIL
jgi:hypothetical protein